MPAAASSACENVAVLHVEHVGAHDRARVQPFEQGSVAPVRGALAPVEQARLAQHERRRAVREDDGPAFVGGSGRLEDGRVVLTELVLG